MKDTSLNKDTDNADVLGKDALAANRNRPVNAWDVLGSLIGQVEGPEDWSEQHDHYLYGTPKK
jgi:hypothetical protein